MVEILHRYGGWLEEDDRLVSVRIEDLRDFRRL